MKTPEDAFAALSEGKLSWGSVFAPKMLTMSWTSDSGWSAARIEAYAPIPLAPSASIFHYGMEVFEGLKAFRSGNQVHLFRPELNVRRMNASAERLALPTIPEDELLRLLVRYVDSVRAWVPPPQLGSLYLRPVTIATDPRIGVRRSESALFYVIACPVGAFFQRREDDRGGVTGVSLLADETYVRAWPGGVGNCKTGGNYALSIAPAEKARGHGFDQVLWLGAGGRIMEAGMMNIFVVRRGAGTTDEGGVVLVTPRADGTILEGVMRRCVMELAGGMGWGCEERDIGIAEVVEGVSDGSVVEVFGTGTAAVVCGVGRIAWNGKVVMVGSHGVGDRLRERIERIQRGGKHEWMVEVPEGARRVDGRGCVTIGNGHA